MARRAAQTIRRAYDLLFAAFGPQGWWPAETRDEVLIGAVLTQNTSWKNVERAIRALRDADRITLDRIRRTPPDRLATLIRSSGTHRVKAGRLRALATWVEERFAGDLDRLFAAGLPAARQELLRVPGVGPETADAILLYAGNLPTFVVDAYTRRVLRRHHLIAASDGYGAVQALFERALPTVPALYGEYHALLVEVGKQYCRKRARCRTCPLATLPHDPDL